MLVQYTPISSLPADQQARLRSYISSMQLEHMAGHVVFEGLTFSKSDVLAHFPRAESRKPTGQQLNG